MKIQIDNKGYRANATNINIIPRSNPFVLIFEGVSGFNHCMTYFAALRSLKKEPYKLTVFRVNTRECMTIDSINNMKNFIEEWRENYFNPNWDGTRRIYEEN